MASSPSSNPSDEPPVPGVVEVDPAYRRLPTQGPHEAALGGALITWVEPMPEHVVGYNRWYEDDRELAGVEHVITLLHFLDVDPRECRDERFASSGETLAAGGAGSLAIQAAFIPTRHGTDAYTDELF